MPDEPIDPATLEGNALTRWYLRSPADIEQERRDAATRRYQQFFNGYPGGDPDPGFDRRFETSGPDIDPGFGRELTPAERNVDPGFDRGLGNWAREPTSTPYFGNNSFSQDDANPSDGSTLGLSRGSSGGPADVGEVWDANWSSGPLAIPSFADAGLDGPQSGPGGADQDDPDPPASAPTDDLSPLPMQLVDASELLAPPAFGFGRQSTGRLPVPLHQDAGIGAPALGGPQNNVGMALTTPPLGNQAAGTPKGKPHSSVGHPGFAESLIPFWGSGREAVADFQEGNYAGAAINGTLAASDLFLAEEIAKGLAKGGIYVVGKVARKAPYDWDKVVRPWMGEKGFLNAGQHGHHWAIPQNGWGKNVPDFIKNQPWNIKPMPSAEVHGRITGRYKGKPQFNAVQRYWYGTPAWSKIGTAAAIGHPIAAAMAQSGDPE